MTAALILAAVVLPEDGKRKPTDALGEVSSIKRIIMVFQQAGIKKIVVVTGSDADALEKHCAHMGVIFLRSETYETGDMLSSVKAGLAYLKNKCSKVFITPVHIPLFSAETVKSMDSADGPVVIPKYNEQAGHPLLLFKSLFKNVLNYDGQGGLSGALSGEDIARHFVEVSDQGILTDTRNSANVSDLIETQGLQTIRPEAKIRLLGEKEFFGPGTLLLLNLTQETGSLKQAAQQMGVSYSKALKMIAGMENQLGYTILESRQGGSGGGSSIITKRGLDFMKRYEAFESECNERIKGAFEKYF
ncbi:MAG: NTP transferase domain-containing protein [Clostridiales bacterium]|nr:NTP transferase domain-containing protein [Clostridiales bacterium]